MALDPLVQAKLLDLGMAMAREAVEGWIGKKLADQSAEETLEAIRVVESARKVRPTAEMIAEGAAAAGAGEAGED